MKALTITDQRGSLLVDDDEIYEPNHGSAVLTGGLHGTVWQRFFSDGLWHSVRAGRARTWDELLAKRNLVLIYDARLRNEPEISTKPKTTWVQPRLTGWTK